MPLSSAMTSVEDAREAELELILDELSPVELENLAREMDPSSGDGLCCPLAAATESEVSSLKRLIKSFSAKTVGKSGKTSDPAEKVAACRRGNISDRRRNLLMAVAGDGAATPIKFDIGKSAIVNGTVGRIVKAMNDHIRPTLHRDLQNALDMEETTRRVAQNDPSLKELNLNNIKNISDEQFFLLFDALKDNSQLEILSMASTSIRDSVSSKLCPVLETNATLRVLNVESNFISPPGLRDLVGSLLPPTPTAKSGSGIEELRVANQKQAVMGYRVEMEIAGLVERNPRLLRLGLVLQFAEARNRVVAHLQRNCDKARLRRIGAGEG